MTMKPIEKSYTTGVIIARFQLDSLHAAHTELIDTVLHKHAKVLIFLGLSQVRGSMYDPLDFQPRKQMILETYPPDKFPNLTIGYVKDNRSDTDWSKKLDEVISEQIGPNDTVVLYGSRDSFLDHYKGHFDTLELQATRYISGTELRAKIAQAPQSNPQFRAGAIWASYQRHPTVYPTVDVLVFDPKERRILLARKPQETGYRLPGGFVNPADESFETAALRELAEETELSVGLNGLRYIGSQRIDDWRYRNNPSEKIMTHLYLGLYAYGAPKANDDIAECRWYDYDKYCEVPGMIYIMEEHRVLMNMAKVYIDTNFPKKP